MFKKIACHKKCTRQNRFKISGSVFSTLLYGNNNISPKGRDRLYKIAGPKKGKSFFAKVKHNSQWPFG